MFSKVQKKLLKVKYAVDSMQLENSILTVKGWIFSSGSKVEDMHLIFKDGRNRFTVSVKYGFERMDVYEAYRNENAKFSGFWGQMVLENFDKFEVNICCRINGKSQEFYIGSVESVEPSEEGMPARARDAEWLVPDISLSELYQEQGKYKFEFPRQYYKEKIDIIVPVYNGHLYLEKLLQTVALTKMQYRLILIDDNSTDERVWKLLENYAGNKRNVVLMRNLQNLGFVETVNKGLEMSENHVALINTDIELPKYWLERLMLPILMDEEIASSTPYTNSGTLCSFPERGLDNGLFLGLDVQTIDAEFGKVRPRYGKIPTGVGFCMGMSKKAIRQAGYLDADSFRKGYGEENDWCQRVIPLGYKNVQVENLFVYHKHGGSFLSEDKKRYMARNRKVLRKKHPYYDVDIARFFARDTHKALRGFVGMNLLKKKENSGVVFVFDHNLGGGASKYLEEKRKEWTAKGFLFGIVRFDLVKKSYKISFYKEKEYEIEFFVPDLGFLEEMMNSVTVNEIWVNEIVSYPDVYGVLSFIRTYSQKRGVHIKMLIHDFFSVCPTINLVGCEDIYCNIPETEICSTCIGRSKLLFETAYGSIDKWRCEWGKLLQMCREVVVFSDSSKRIMEKVYGPMEQLKVLPHKIKFLPRLNKKYKTTDTLNIGLLGMLTEHKGLRIIRKMIEIIQQENLNIRLILIGCASEGIFDPVFHATGEYTRGNVPKLVLENDIDVFFISSIWPETFSYTTGEIMEMGMPVMCFDIGAPAERVRRYAKGVVLPEISVEAVFKAINTEEVLLEYKEKEKRNIRILFVVEAVTFSSRYRVDHLREQLLYQGVASDCVSIYEVKECELEQYANVVVYRSSETGLVNDLVVRVHKQHKKIFYDIDDYIFEYDKIKYLKFLEGEDYADFKTYSDNIYRTMELCDGYIVSTDNLKCVTEQKLKGKPVVVNRNVSSVEMQIISMEARKNEHAGNAVVKLGYFCGSKTHDADFSCIKDTLLYVMETRENVHLIIGGTIELPQEFQALNKRIHRFDFVPWRDLPELIADADINLMPLEDTVFHWCKSENKWMEAALAGVPTVASRNSELEQVIEHGVTGYLCEDKEQWKDIILELIDNKEQRRKVAEAANQKVLERYTPLCIEQEVMELLTS